MRLNDFGERIPLSFTAGSFHFWFCNKYFACLMSIFAFCATLSPVNANAADRMHTHVYDCLEVWPFECSEKIHETTWHNLPTFNDEYPCVMTIYVLVSNVSNAKYDLRITDGDKSELLLLWENYVRNESYSFKMRHFYNGWKTSNGKYFYRNNKLKIKSTVREANEDSYRTVSASISVDITGKCVYKSVVDKYYP